MKAPRITRPEFTCTTNHPWLVWLRMLPFRVRFALLHSRITIQPTYKGKPMHGKIHMRVIPKITIVKEDNA